jgi:hypothetical protein
MVTVGMGDVNICEIFAALGDPIHQLLRMLDKQKRIDEDGIAFAVNERDRIGNPSEIFFARGKALGRATALLSQKLPIQLTHVIIPFSSTTAALVAAVHQSVKW